MYFNFTILKVFFGIVCFLTFLPKIVFSQTNFDLNGIWISYDYRCYELNGNFITSFFFVQPEVFNVSQDSMGFVSAMKCIGDECVPAGHLTWSGNIVDSTVTGDLFLGGVGSNIYISVPIILSIVNDSLIISDQRITYRKISCSEYRKIVVPKYSTYYDCHICDDYFDIPNVFTPNGDGVNDNWTFFLTKDVTLLNFDIYDRWGVLEKTIEKKRPNKDEERTTSGSWDGISMGGLPCKAGVYFYVIKFLDGENKIKNKSGYIHLFRE